MSVKRQHIQAVSKSRSLNKPISQIGVTAWQDGLFSYHLYRERARGSFKKKVEKDPGANKNEKGAEKK